MQEQSPLLLLICALFSPCFIPDEDVISARYLNNIMNSGHKNPYKLVKKKKKNFYSGVVVHKSSYWQHNPFVPFPCPALSKSQRSVLTKLPRDVSITSQKLHFHHAPVCSQCSSWADSIPDFHNEDQEIGAAAFANLQQAFSGQFHGMHKCSTNSGTGSSCLEELGYLQPWRSKLLV